MIEIYNKYLHLIISAFLPYSDIKIVSASINIDNKIFAYKDNLRFCHPFPNKNYYVLQQKPSHRNRNENGLLFLIPDPKTDKINVTVDWEWVFEFRPNDIMRSVQNIEFTIDLSDDGVIKPEDVLCTGRNSIPTMVFTLGSFDDIDWKMESFNSVPEFFNFNEYNDLIKSIKQKSILKIHSMEQWRNSIDKTPNVFDHWEIIEFL